MNALWFFRIWTAHLENTNDYQKGSTTMKKQNNQNLNATEVTTTNPFDNLEAIVTKQTTRKLVYTDQLQAAARSRAIELTKACTDPERADKANAMLATGNVDTLLGLIHDVFTDETIKEDAAFMEHATEEELAKMLESQRSNRSKAKRSGLNTMTNVLGFISAMYAELMIRSVSGKAYNASGNKLTDDRSELAADNELLTKKINSLASKKSRLSKLAIYDASAKAELEQVEAELKELRGLRPERTKTVVKSKLQDEVRAALSSLDEKDMTPELLALMEKLG